MPEHYLQDRSCALTAQQRGILPFGVHPFEKRAVPDFRLDDGVSGARYLSGQGSNDLPATIWAASVLFNVSPQLIAKPVLALTGGDLGGHVEGAPQANNAIFGKLGSAAGSAGLTGGQIEPAEFEKLTIMGKSAKVGGLLRDGCALIGPV